MATYPTRLHVHERDPLFRRCPSQKIAYDSKAEALDVCEVQMLQGRVLPGHHLTPYLCERCARWHVCNHKIYFPPLSAGRLYDTKE
jgi:hypothetical protein